VEEDKTNVGAGMETNVGASMEDDKTNVGVRVDEIKELGTKFHGVECDSIKDIRNEFGDVDDDVMQYFEIEFDGLKDDVIEDLVSVMHDEDDNDELIDKDEDVEGPNEYEVEDDNEDKDENVEGIGLGINLDYVVKRWARLINKMNKGESVPQGRDKSKCEGTFDNHEIHQDYTSDELVSDVDEEGNCVQKFLKFRMQDLSMNFKFKVGMEFASFKQDIMKHYVLNGREVEFVKNDHVRVRAICKKRFGFVMLEVGVSETFRLKALV